MNPSWEIRFIWFNHGPKLADGTPNPCANILVRKAIHHAIDIPALLDATVGAGFYELINDPQPGFVTVGGYSVHNESLPKPLYAYDPDTARTLLKDAGYGAGMTLKYYFWSGDPIIQSISQFVQSYLAEVGITLELQQFESTTFYNEVAFKPAETHEWNIAYARTDCSPDACVGPYFILHQDMLGDWNWGGWDNKEFSDLITEAFTEIDDQARANLYKRANTIAAEDVSNIWLYNMLQSVAYNEDFQGWRWIAHPMQGFGHGLYPLSMINIYYVPAQQVTTMTAIETTVQTVTTAVSEFTSITALGLAALLVPFALTRRRKK